MPSHTVHAYLDRLYFKKAYWKVHRLMDSAWYVCRKGHRRYYHDWLSAYAIAVNAYPGDENAIRAAWLHIQTDEQCNANPAYRRELEMTARAEVKERRKRGRRKKEEPMPPAVKKLLVDCENLTEIQRLRDLILS